MIRNYRFMPRTYINSNSSYSTNYSIPNLSFFYSHNDIIPYYFNSENIYQMRIKMLEEQVLYYEKKCQFYENMFIEY